MPRFDRPTLLGLIMAFGVAFAVGVACGDDEGDHEGEQTGASCEHPDDCYPDTDHDEIAGNIICMDRVEHGYCTHLCNSDADCCAAEGECEPDVRHICAPFENSTEMRCFVACESEDLGDADENDYCHDHAHREFGCRSSGGGSQNRKVCVSE